MTIKSVAPRKPARVPAKPPGATEKAVIDDLRQYDLARFPTARPLAASARALAKALDTDPTAAVARELRLILEALARVCAAQTGDQLEGFLADLRKPVGDEAR